MTSYKEAKGVLIRFDMNNYNECRKYRVQLKGEKIKTRLKFELKNPDININRIHFVVSRKFLLPWSACK